MKALAHDRLLAGLVNWSERFLRGHCETPTNGYQEGPHRGRSTLGCSSIDMPDRMPSIDARTMEEHQIRVRVEFGVERQRTVVERDRIKVEEF
jgi:hypothetical protein